MFDIGWMELLIIGIVALIVVGPKDLPRMFHTLGQFTAKARAMAREFSRSMEEAARESGVDQTARDLRSMTSAKNLGLDALEKAAKSATQGLDSVRRAAKGDVGALLPDDARPSTDDASGGSAGTPSAAEDTGAGGAAQAPAAPDVQRAAPRAPKPAAGRNDAGSERPAPKARKSARTSGSKSEPQA